MQLNLPEFHLPDAAGPYLHLSLGAVTQQIQSSHRVYFTPVKLLRRSLLAASASCEKIKSVAVEEGESRI